MMTSNAISLLQFLHDNFSPLNSNLSPETGCAVTFSIKVILWNLISCVKSLKMRGIKYNHFSIFLPFFFTTNWWTNEGKEYRNKM